MKKVIIAGSASNRSSSEQWVQYWLDAGLKVIDYPVKNSPRRISELLYQLGNSNVEIILLKMPESSVQCIDEVVLWLKLGWIRLHTVN